jgi:hypothetical protein
VNDSPRTSNGVSSRHPFDRWYRYPAGFSPFALDLALGAVHIPDQDGMLIDPFAGTASVGTATITRGATFVGLEAHPEIAELADLKFQRRTSLSSITDVAAEVIASRVPGSTETEHDLVTRCFEETTLSELVGIRQSIVALRTNPWSTHLKWALLATLRDVASVKVGWPYQRPALTRCAPHRDPNKRFLQRIRWMAEDLDNAPPALESKVIAGDSRESSSWHKLLGTQTADACVSSPPYLNNFDYADATRIELYFWGAANSWRTMCDTVRSGMIVATTQQTRIAVAAAAEEQLAIYPTFHRNICSLIKKLEGERLARGRGKEYDRVVAPYFLGVASVLSNLFEVLQPGALCAWVIGDSAPYGVYVDTPALISALAVDLGFEPVADSKVRSRGNRWQSNGVRPPVDLTERLVTLARP